MYASLCVNMWTRKRTVSLTPFSLQIHFFQQALSVSIWRIQDNNFCLYSNLKDFYIILLLYVWLPMSVNESLSRFLSLSALLDPWVPSLLHSSVMGCRTCAYVYNDLFLSLALVSQTPHPACSYFPILPCPSCSRILLISSNLKSSVCCLFLVLCFLSCPFCTGFFTALADIYFLCTLPFPFSFCCLPGSLLCSCPSCRISQPGGMCWRSKL